MKSATEQNMHENAEMQDSGLGLMMIVLLVLTVVAALAT